jgi:hypothetical protein
MNDLKALYQFSNKKEKKYGRVLFPGPEKSL